MIFEPVLIILFSYRLQLSNSSPFFVMTTAEPMVLLLSAILKPKRTGTQIMMSTAARMISAFLIMRKFMAHLHVKNRILRFFTAVIVSVFIIPQTACGTGRELPVSGQDFCFDTVCSVTIYDMETGGSEEAQKLIDDVFSECDRYESLLSRTREGSDIRNINSAEGESVKCDDVTIDVIKKGIEYCAMSDGAFDITVGSLSKLWDFKSEKPEVPAEEDIKEAVSHIGYDNIEIHGNEVTLKDPLCEIDLGAIAKGYIADRLTSYMEKRGVRSAVISLGGNIVCIGEKRTGTDTEKFRIGIETPYSDMKKISGVTEMSDGTAVTSGVYERYFEADGKKYHHILDPETGYPAETDLLSVTVISKKGRSSDCDALATICILEGLEEGKKLVESIQGYEGLFIDNDGEQYATSGFFYERR